MKNPLIILTGPTASGKTSLSIELAKAVGGEIISADSMQVYKYMDIGSAKIRPEEMKGIPHYLVDVLEPDEEFHVVRFQEMAKHAMKRIRNNGHIPIVVGGTGFYIQALLYDIDFTKDDGDTGVRKGFASYEKAHGAESLHRLLREVDPVSADQIHPNNVRRVIRALEFYEKTGLPISEHNAREKQKRSPYDFAYFVLNDERSRLYERINARVDAMLKEGLVEEVRALKEKGYGRDLVSMKGLGYKEILDYLDGMCTLEEAIYRIKRDTRHFAKRQITWFKREKDVVWIDKKACHYEEKEILDTILKHLEGVLCCGDYWGDPGL